MSRVPSGQGPVSLRERKASSSSSSFSRVCGPWQQRQTPSKHLRSLLHRSPLSELFGLSRARSGQLPHAQTRESNCTQLRKAPTERRQKREFTTRESLP